MSGCGVKFAEYNKNCYVTATGGSVSHVYPSYKVGWIACGSNRDAQGESVYYLPFCEDCAIKSGLVW